MRDRGHLIKTMLRAESGIKTLAEIVRVMFAIVVGKLGISQGNVQRVDIAPVGQRAQHVKTIQMGVGVQLKELLLIEASR